MSAVWISAVGELQNSLNREFAFQTVGGESYGKRCWKNKQFSNILLVSKFTYKNNLSTRKNQSVKSSIKPTTKNLHRTPFPTSPVKYRYYPFLIDRSTIINCSGEWIDFENIRILDVAAVYFHYNWIANPSA